MILTLLFITNTAFVLIAISAIIYALVGSSKNKKGTNKISPKIKKFVILGAIILCIGLGFANNKLTSIKQLAIDKGATNTDLKTMNITKLYDNTTIAPKETTLPNDLTNTLIVVYTFGDERYTKINEDLKSSINVAKIDKIYWVSSSSKQGKTLLKKYPVSAVPSMIYVYKSDLAETYITKPLYNEDIKTNTVSFNAENFNEIMEKRSNFNK
mgnify:CR=1 FL=1